MDTQQIFNIILTFSGFLGGYVLKNITNKLDQLDKDIRKMPLTYVTKDDYRLDIAELKQMCRQIFDKLDNKEDKK